MEASLAAEAVKAAASRRVRAMHRNRREGKSVVDVRLAQ
jgi:hypothetical protein